MKKKLKPLFWAAVVVCVCSALFIWHSIANKKEEKKFVIGFSQCVDDLWRRTMVDGMNRELAFHPDLSLKYREAGGNSQTQIRQVRELLSEKIDLLIISPNETDPLTPIVEEIYTSGIPVIVIDRKTSSRFYTAFVGTDNYEIGKLAGEYGASALKGKGNALEIFGLTKSSPAFERHNGFEAALKSHPAMSIVSTVYGEWMKNTAEQEIEKAVPKDQRIDLVFAHNDVMALGAYEVFKKRRNFPMPTIIGVDGVAGDAGGMQFVTDHRLSATMMYLTGGEESIQIAAKILNKQDFRKENYLQTSVVDTNNVRLFQLQAAKVVGQQQQIERQQAKLSDLTELSTNLQTFLYILITSLALAIILGGVALYSLFENRKINRKLKSQNLEILDQKNQIMDMAAKTHEANEARVNFFTNISHEFRTPLTLILGPVEDLMEKKKILPGSNNLSLIHKNASRLLQLVDQLIDFRKMESNKMKLRVSEIDLIGFTSEILESYKLIADRKHIDLKLVTKERFLPVWVDPTIFDKVIFNVLSNAMKFTESHGSITVHITRCNNDNLAIIKVEDSGRGMTRDEQDRIFDLYYQGNTTYARSSSGIGLAVTKSFLDLHHGKIEVNSIPGEGSTFIISLRLGNEHYEKDQIYGNVSSSITDISEPGVIHMAELKEIYPDKPFTDDFQVSHELSIVIIEDNVDLRAFVKSKLTDSYEVYEAGDGESAKQQVFNHLPDLIICDIMLPDQDGLSLTGLFKSDPRTSHIPVVLLTAQTNNDQKIAAMKLKADAYLTKPFNIHYLHETISSLLSNRTRMREHLITDLAGNTKSNGVKKGDRKFLNEFTTYIESNIGNPDLSVEDICVNLGISKVQLYRKIREGLDISINEYILNTRLNKAKYLLQDETLTISEISYQVGFSSASYFSTVFKGRFNMTPKEFRS